MEESKDCVIIGAGITGLTAAFYLQRAGLDFRVLEEKDRVGGVIKTIREDGFLFETGPNSGVLGQPEAAQLFEDLGDAVELEIAQSAVKKRYVLKDGRWQAMPAGLIQAIRTPLFSFADKLRVLGEPFRRKGTDPEENLKQMVVRRLGKTYLEYAVDPFILGVYAGDPEQLIPKYALPKLYRLEQEYGSFIGGAIKKKFQKPKSEADQKATREVFSVKGGLQALVLSLHEKSESKNFSLGCSDIKIKKTSLGYNISWISQDGELQAIQAKNIIITTGSHKLPGLLPDLKKNQLESLTNLRYAKVVEVAIGFKAWNGMKLDGFGGLIPFKENRDLLGILFLSAFLDGRAPDKGALFTVFIGGIRRPELFELSDEKIFETVKNEFTALMGLDRFQPDLFKLFRHQWAIPQYEKSSGRRFSAVAQIEEEFKGLYLRGNFQGGIGLADRIRQGKLGAMQIIESL